MDAPPLMLADVTPDIEEPLTVEAVSPLPLCVGVVTLEPVLADPLETVPVVPLELVVPLASVPAVPLELVVPLTSVPAVPLELVVPLASVPAVPLELDSVDVALDGGGVDESVTTANERGAAGPFAAAEAPVSPAGVAAVPLPGEAGVAGADVAAGGDPACAAVPAADDA